MTPSHVCHVLKHVITKNMIWCITVTELAMTSNICKYIMDIDKGNVYMCPSFIVTQKFTSI